LTGVCFEKKNSLRNFSKHKNGAMQEKNKARAEGGCLQYRREEETLETDSTHINRKRHSKLAGSRKKKHTRGSDEGEEEMAAGGWCLPRRE